MLNLYWFPEPHSSFVNAFFNQSLWKVPSISHVLPWGLRWYRVHPQCRRPGFDPWVEKIPGEGNGNPLQYPVDRGAWWAVVPGVAKSRTQPSDFFPEGS